MTTGVSTRSKRCQRRPRCAARWGDRPVTGSRQETRGGAIWGLASLPPRQKARHRERQRALEGCYPAPSVNEKPHSPISAATHRTPVAIAVYFTASAGDRALQETIATRMVAATTASAP